MEVNSEHTGNKTITTSVTTYIDIWFNEYVHKAHPLYVLMWM